MTGPTAAATTTPAFAEIHDELREVARGFLGARTPLTGDGGPSAPLDWPAVAGMGWIGLEVPEALDGAGATFAEVAVVLEELGRAAAVSPYLGTAVLGIGTLALVEPNPARDELLAGVAGGDVHLATAVVDGDHDAARPEPPFVLDGGPDRARLHGEACFVPDAPNADELLLFARDGAGRLVVVNVPADRPGVRVTPQPLLDATHSVGVVSVAGIDVSDSSVWRFAGDADQAAGEVFARGAVAVACDGLGLSKAMLDATVAYAGVRHQFGRPIGSFQAVKHACADMLVRIAACEQLVAAAVDALVAGDPDAWVAAARAKAYVGAAAVDVVGKALQLHGGIGYTWESGVHVYLKRATLDRALLGSPMAHRRRLAGRLVERDRLRRS